MDEAQRSPDNYANSTNDKTMLQDIMHRNIENRQALDDLVFNMTELLDRVLGPLVTEKSCGVVPAADSYGLVCQLSDEASTTAGSVHRLAAQIERLRSL